MTDPAWMLLLAGLAAALSALLGWPVSRWLRRRGMLDQPGQRRSHQQPTPRGGGLAIVLSLILLWLLWPGAIRGWMPVMPLLLLLALTGWRDDRQGLAARWRFMAQLAAAGILLAIAGGVSTVILGGTELQAAWLWTPLALVAVVWLINLHNFMDGSDGMAAAQGTWFLAGAALLFRQAGELELATFSAAAAGAWLGFLVWNRPPARVFMGDTGSLALGLAVAACAVFGLVSGAFGIAISFMLCASFVVDATATLLWRAARGERWYTAHRQHAYQQLIALGWSHGQVLSLYMLVNVLLVLPAIAMALRWPQLDTVLAAGLALILALGWRVVQSAATTRQRQG